MYSWGKYSFGRCKWLMCSSCLIKPESSDITSLKIGTKNYSSLQFEFVNDIWDFKQHYFSIAFNFTGWIGWRDVCVYYINIILKLEEASSEFSYQQIIHFIFPNFLDIFMTAICVNNIKGPSRNELNRDWVTSQTWTWIFLYPKPNLHHNPNQPLP